jgi:hypothetical protein
LLVLVVVSVIAVVLIAAGSLRSETRALVAYLEEARSVAMEHADQSVDFKERLISGLQSLDRDRLTTLITQMIETSTAGSSRLEGLEVPSAGAPAAAAFSLAIASWESGLTGFEEALLGVVDDPDNVVAVGALADVLVEFEIGDRAYARFMEAATAVRSEADVEIGDFPEVGYLSVALSSLTYAERLAGVATRSPGLALSRDLAIAAVRFDPEETGGVTDGAPILPNTDTLLIQVVVVNQGNRDEGEISVSMVLQDGTGAVLADFSDDLPELTAGESRTVEFSGVPVTSGEKLLAIISVSFVDGEEDTDNNRIEKPLFVNEPA